MLVITYTNFRPPAIGGQFVSLFIFCDFSIRNEQNAANFEPLCASPLLLSYEAGLKKTVIC